jgi:hypothetical protein
MVSTVQLESGTDNCSAGDPRRLASPGVQAVLAVEVAVGKTADSGSSSPADCAHGAGEPDPKRVWERLHSVEFDRHVLTVKSWMYDENRICPKDIEDVRKIAEASGDRTLLDALPQVRPKRKIRPSESGNDLPSTSEIESRSARPQEGLS